MQLLHLFLLRLYKLLRPQTPKNIPPVIIKPKQKQDAEVTKTELKSKINPSQLNVSINSMKTAKNEVVVIIISCNSEQKCQKLIRNIQEQDTEDKYTLQLPQMKKTRFKLIMPTTNDMNRHHKLHKTTEPIYTR